MRAHCSAISQLFQMLGQNVDVFEADNRQRGDKIAIVLR